MLRYPVAVSFERCFTHGLGRNTFCIFRQLVFGHFKRGGFGLKRVRSRFLGFLFAVLCVICIAVLIAVARKGVPFETAGRMHNRFIVGVKIAFLVCIALFGLFQNRVIQKGNR